MTVVVSETKSIELGVDQIRSRLDTHLNELQGRLSPGQVVDDLMAYFRGKEGAEFGRNLLGSVRSNPLPAAITGIGLAWLMASKPRAGTSAQVSTATGSSRVRVYQGTPDLGLDSHGAMTTRLRDAELGVTQEHGEAEAVYAARLDDARGQAIGLSRHAEENPASYSQRIRDTLTAAQEAVTRGAHDLRDQVGDAAISVGSTAQGAFEGMSGATQRAGDAMTHGSQAAGQAGSNLITTLSESPVLLGALGLAAGALLGALLPQSKQEETALGDIAGQARDTARSFAQEAVDKGGHVAQIVLDKGRDSAEAQGLTGGKSAGQLVDAAMSGELAGSIKQVATDALQAGDVTVRKETLGEGKEAAQPG